MNTTSDVWLIKHTPLFEWKLAEINPYFPHPEAP